MAEIPMIPNVPRPLLAAAQQRKLVPFVGAGVSRLAGAPGWEDFANRALDLFLASKHISHADRDLMREYVPRVKLSIAEGLQDDTTRITYEDILHPDKKFSNEDGRTIYRNIGKLSDVFVTTNYDRWLDIVFPDELSDKQEESTSSQPSVLQRTALFKKEHFEPIHLDGKNNVFHIHGSCEDQKSMVVTTRRYLDHYRSTIDRSGAETNPLRTFLKFLFRTRNILFIGYGLAELEILEYVIQAAGPQSTDDGLSPRHYILLPFYSHQSGILRHLEKYYRDQCNVGLLPYRLDENGHRQLIEVTAAFSQQLEPGGTAEIRDLEDLKALLDDE